MFFVVRNLIDNGIDKLTLAGFFKMAFAQLLIFRGFTYAVESLISTNLK
jgi:hypothetical protein